VSVSCADPFLPIRKETLAKFSNLLRREKASRVTVQQEVEPSGFFQFFNRRPGGRKRAAGDHRTMIGQQHRVMLMCKSLHSLGELLVAWPVSVECI
jgi:hypothetical protein